MSNVLNAIGDILGFGIGVALSPMAIVGFILMLVSAGGLPKAWAFIAGWAIGIAIVLILLGTFVSGTENDSSDANNALLGWIRIALGLGMVYLAWHTFQGRPQAGEEAMLPKWMQAMDTVTPVKALGLGAFLAAVNPKNLPLLISAAGTIGQAGLNGGQMTATYFVFVIIATLGMLVPIVIYLAAGERGAAILDATRTWLVDNNATIMAVLFVVLGANIIGKGIGSF